MNNQEESKEEYKCRRCAQHGCRLRHFQLEQYIRHLTFHQFHKAWIFCCRRENKSPWQPLEPFENQDKFQIAKRKMADCLRKLSRKAKRTEDEEARFVELSDFDELEKTICELREKTKVELESGVANDSADCEEQRHPQKKAKKRKKKPKKREKSREKSREKLDEKSPKKFRRIVRVDSESSVPDASQNLSDVFSDVDFDLEEDLKAII